MPVSQKRILLSFIGLLAGVFLLIIALPRFLDIAPLKRELEARASAAYGMQVTISGDVNLALLPGLRFNAGELHAARDGADFISARTVSVGVDLLPLLRGEVRINSVVIDSPVLALARDRDGNFNFERRSDYTGELPGLNLQQITITNATVHFADAQRGADYQASACGIVISDLSLAGRVGIELLKNQQLDAELHCEEVRRDGVVVTDLDIRAQARDQVFHLEPLTLQAFGAQGSGTAQLDFSGAEPRYTLEYTLPGFRSAEFLQALAPEQTIEGSLDFATQLTMYGSSTAQLKRTLAGAVSLHGQQLLLHGVDLDAEFARYESTQNFNLVDMGAFFFAGPLGVAVTKGYDFAGIFGSAGSQSEIRLLVSDWTVSNGLAQAQDVALATAQNRIALQGGLDFAAGEFRDMKMALLDANGCATIEQAIEGSFQAPDVASPGILRALAGPAISLVQRGIEMLPGEPADCTPFYTGSLQPGQ